MIIESFIILGIWDKPFMNQSNSNATIELAPNSQQANNTMERVVSKLDISQFSAEGASAVLKVVTEHEKNHRGVLGWFLGESKTLPYKISSISILLLLLSGIVYSFWHPNSSFSPKDMWVTISPFITLSAGFLFGSNNKKPND